MSNCSHGVVPYVAEHHCLSVNIESFLSFYLHRQKGSVST